MARNLASVIISSFFIRCASSVNVCFRLRKEQYGHNYHYIEPGGLRSNDRCNAIRNERNDNGSDPEHMKLRLLDVIIQGKQQP